MLMGKLVSNKKYEYFEYITAGMISMGMTFFMLGSEEADKGKIQPRTSSKMHFRFSIY